MRCSDTIGKLALALVNAQGELRTIGKDSINPHFKNRYLSLDKMIEETRPILAKNGLAILQSAGMGEEGFSVETMLLHASGEWIANLIPVPMPKADPQGAGSATTYGRRYGYSAILSLAADEDDDGAAGSAAGRATPAAQSTQPAARPASPSAPLPPAPPNPLLMPFGKFKGSPLGQLPSDELQRTVQWCKGTNPEKFRDLINRINAILTDRALGTTEEAALARMTAADEDDGLPF